MKNLIVVALTLGLAGSLFGDIQDPPANDYGPTRKLGRGLSNFFLAPAEIPVTRVYGAQRRRTRYGDRLRRSSDAIATFSQAASNWHFNSCLFHCRQARI